MLQRFSLSSLSDQDDVGCVWFLMYSHTPRTETVHPRQPPNPLVPSMHKACMAGGQPASVIFSQQAEFLLLSRTPPSLCHSSEGTYIGQISVVLAWCEIGTSQSVVLLGG